MKLWIELTKSAQNEVVDKTDEVSSKQCFEIVDRTDEVSNLYHGKATLTWFELDFRRV
ncbi:hypothetical protein [Streptococcus pneumoniae]|uniref:hypothetical protein n=1 Tax=Streptococcus pneumoniae TaxID=1313 RepID=UPI00099A0FC2|nr:hypothetical protein [Streptococcus pneumoniae]